MTKLTDLGDFLVPRRRRCPGKFVFGMFNGYREDCKGGRMVLRLNRKEGTLFWGCSNWPQCTHAVPFSTLDIPFKARMALLKERK